MEIFASGILVVPVRKQWYQFWLPKYVNFGTYTQVGRFVQLCLPDRIVTYSLDQEVKK